jgi:hypothetical protein
VWPEVITQIDREHLRQPRATTAARLSYPLVAGFAEATRFWGGQLLVPSGIERATTESLRPETARDTRIFCGQKIRENDIDRVKIVFTDGARNGSPALR